MYLKNFVCWSFWDIFCILIFWFIKKWKKIEVKFCFCQASEGPDTIAFAYPLRLRLHPGCSGKKLFEEIQQISLMTFAHFSFLINVTRSIFFWEISIFLDFMHFNFYIYGLGKNQAFLHSTNFVFNDKSFKLAIHMYCDILRNISWAVIFKDIHIFLNFLHFNTLACNWFRWEN